MTIISTLSFLILSVVKHFLDVLHLSLWNLLHILCPLALLGCLFPSFSNIPKGIFIGMLELSLWKPTWVILARILIALGFGETPTDPSQWFDTAVMNFAVAGLMVSTPMIVHGFLSGTLASVGGTAVQTMLAGAGAALATLPMQTIRGTAALTQRTAGSIGQRTWSYTKAQLRPTKPQANPNLNQKPNTYSKGNQFYGVPKTHRDPSTKPKK